MTTRTWHTAEDIHNDIPIISGRRGRRVPVANIDQGYMVIGDEPPPIRREAEDNEMQEMFGSMKLEHGALNSEHPPPDLQGITSLLRLVQQSDDCANEEVKNTTQSSGVIAITKPSKLNPNVREFIPKATITSHISSSGEFTNDKSEIDETFVTKLKNEIIDQKSETFEAKKQKNVAIAALLRMYAAKKGDAVTCNEQVKLFTPDYFINKSNPVTPVTDLECRTPITTSVTPTPDSRPVQLPSNNPSCSSSRVNSEPALPTRETLSPTKLAIIDPTIKQSIDKVNQWFKKPSAHVVQKKTSLIYTAPIIYKKKEPKKVVSKSPSPSCDAQMDNQDQKQYIPSNYAAELEKKYNENVKKKKKDRNMWKDLHVILKERDEELARKQL